jgi:peptidoglycan/LPS O-acetylase OafA/YrhL
MGAARQRELDVVRGTAILLVLVFHFRLSLGMPLLDALLQPVFAIGWAGVDLFFVLSGFLVGRMILIEAASPPGFDRRRFFVRRAWRLWPVSGLYCAVLLAVGGAGAWSMVWPVLLHVQNFTGHSPSHLWSLAVEEHFYLGAAVLIPILYRRGGYRRVERMLIGIMAMCLLLRLGGVLAGVPMLHLQWQTQYRIDAPAFGVLIASVSLRCPLQFAALARTRAWWFAVAVGGAVVLGVAGDGAFRHGVGFTIAYLSAGAFLLALYGARMPVGLVWPAGRIAALGLIAYPVYIWHASIGMIVRAAGLPSPLAFVGAGVVAIAVGAALHTLVERPALRWSRRAKPPEISLNAIANHSL